MNVLAAAAVLFAAFLGPISWADDPQICEPMCEEVKNDQELLLRHCGTQPAAKRIPSQGERDELKAQEAEARKNPEFREKNVSGDPDYDRCVFKFYVEHSALAYQCAVLDRTRQAQDATNLMLLLYGAATAACGAACLTSAAPFVGPAAVACPLASGVAAADDIKRTMKFAKGGDWIDATGKSLCGPADEKPSFVSSFDAALEASPYAAGGAAATVALGPCPSAIALGVVTAVKSQNLGTMERTAERACAEVIRLGIDAQFVRLEGDDVSRGGFGGGGGGGVLIGGAPRGASGRKVAKSSDTAKALLKDSGALIAAATAAGELDPLFRKTFPDPKKIPDILSGLKRGGVNLDTFADKLFAGGGGLAPVLSVPGAGDAAKARIARLNSEIYSKLGEGSVPVAADGGAKVASAGQMVSFGAVATPTETVARFHVAAKTPAAVESNDIWHEGESSSIFEIVSRRIERGRGRVEQADWVSPLNRALIKKSAKSD